MMAIKSMGDRSCDEITVGQDDVREDSPKVRPSHACTLICPSSRFSPLTYYIFDFNNLSK